MENAVKLSSITVVQAALTLCLAGPAFAANLSAPVSLETSATLPQGVRNPRFLNVLTVLDTKFDADGGLEPLGNRLNKRVTWQDVIDSQADQSQKNLVQSTVDDLKDKYQKEGKQFGNSPGFATGVVHTAANIKVPVLAMGLTDSLTVGLVVPVVSLDVSVDTGFTRQGDGQAFVDYICDSSPEKCNEAARKLNTATQQKLQRLGYRPIQSETINGMGDIQLMSKYRWFGDTSSALATKLALVLPTGTKMNSDKALDLTTGDGRFKVALGVVYDRFLTEGGLRWNTYATYTALLPSRHVKRLPVSGEDSLSSDKEELTRRYGDQIAVGTGLEYPFDSLGLIVGAALSSQYLSKTRYSGSATSGYTRDRYTMLENLEPAQVLHALSASVGFSTVSWYRQKKFALPFQVNAVYSHPLGGKNAPKGDLVAGEMVLFF